MCKQTEAQYEEFWNDKWWINHSGKYTFIYPLHLIWISSGQKLFELCSLSETGLWYFIRKNCKFFYRFFSHKDFRHPHQFTHFCHIERTFLVINTLTLNLKDWSPQKKIARFINFFYVDEKYDFWYETKMYKNRTSSVTIITNNEILKKWNMATSLLSLSLLWVLFLGSMKKWSYSTCFGHCSKQSFISYIFNHLAIQMKL